MWLWSKSSIAVFWQCRVHRHIPRAPLALAAKAAPISRRHSVKRWPSSLHSAPQNERDCLSTSKSNTYFVGLFSLTSNVLLSTWNVTTQRKQITLWPWIHCCFLERYCEKRITLQVNLISLACCWVGSHCLRVSQTSHNSFRSVQQLCLVLGRKDRANGASAATPVFSPKNNTESKVNICLNLDIEKLF